MELDDTGCLADAVSLPPVSCCWKPPLDYLTSLCMLQRLAVSRQALVALHITSGGMLVPKDEIVMMMCDGSIVGPTSSTTNLRNQ